MRQLKHLVLSVLFGLSCAVAVLGQASPVVGTWTFDLGGGMKATVDYRANGTFTQTTPGMTIEGTYTVSGTTLTTEAQGAKTAFAIVAADAKTLTLKRQRDGRTVVHQKK